MAKTKKKNGADLASSDALTSSSTSIFVMVVDVSPLAWGERDIQRSAQDRARQAAGKRSIGPCTLEELLTAVQAFCASFTSIERGAALLILGVADQETAVLYPRKDALQQWLEHPESYSPAVQDIPQQFLDGVSSLLGRAAQKADANLKRQQKQQAEEQKQSQEGVEKPAQKTATAADQTSRQGAIASAVSRALCLLNRIMVATQATGGVSALHSTHYLQRTEDDGVVALMGNKKKGKKGGNQSAWSPRILIVQASEDRARDYNAMMNCAFCASQQNVVVDGCFLTAGGPKRSASSPFLEQVCDLTQGVYLAPSGAAQVGGALTEVLISVFLPRVDCRPALQLPALNKVDFRARCFETAEMVDLAHVCNQCLSIFATNPAKNSSNAASGPPRCPTCQARIMTAAEKRR